MEDFDYSMDDLNDTVDSVDVPNDVTDVVDTSSELEPDIDSMSLDELYALRDELMNSDASDSSPYSFNWDGTPTHNVEWDDEEDPDVAAKVLKR